MSIAISDLVGFVGIGFVLSCHLLVQMERMNARSTLYLILNIAGCALIIYSLAFNFNLPSLVIQVTWMFISAYGLMRNLFWGVRK